MSPTLALSLMVASAALHAAWNVALRRQPDTPAASLLFLAAGCGFTLAGAVLQAVLGEVGPGQLKLAILWGLAAGASEGLYVVSLSRALRIGPLATVYSVSRGLPVLVLWPLSHALLGEPIALRTTVAVALLLAGLAVLTPSRTEPVDTTSRAGYLWALLTAVFNVTNSLVYKAALVRGAALLPLPAMAFLLATPVAASSLVWLREPGGALDRPLHRLAAAFLAAPLLVLLGGFCLAASFAISLLALRAQGAAWVLTMRNLSIAFAPLLAWAALGERPSRRALAGVSLVFAGALVLGAW